MPSVINTNLPSLNTQRNLSASQTALNTSIQRLSSGLRVNSAKDDAAGLAIAERMNSQVRGLNVAARNANDGVSLAQTAEGALGKIGEMVQRIRELAVQSANATNSNADRAALQAEVVQLKDEIDRLAQTTNFNGTRLLDGSFAAATFQIGADAGQAITVAGITDAQLTGFSASDAEVRQPISDIATLAAIDVGTSIVFDVEGTPVPIGPLPAASSKEERAAQVVEAINRVTAKTGVTAYIDGDDLVLNSGSAIVFDATMTGTAATVGFAPADADGATAATGEPSSKTMVALDISTYGGAQFAIRQADAALDQINGARAKLGALQTRFESAVANIQIAAENTTAARSRIMDADFAAETAALTRAQILQQAGNAMLSQANQLPQQVLTLLKG